ncbi:hypothetical protein [Actinomycetospora flava]|uniref:Uncharacterized protein n=1 Tax=Actinomycetospora flava TaxID=3129232 RepID=A0ABU8M6K5_9PSEU
MPTPRSWLAVAALLVALPFGAWSVGTPPAPDPPSAEIVTGTVGQESAPRPVPTPARAPSPTPDLERGVVPDSPA